MTTPPLTGFQRAMISAFVVAVKKYGVRGLAREAGVSPTYVSRIRGGHEQVPVEGKLAEFLRAEATKAEPPPIPDSAKEEIRQLRAEIDRLRKLLLKTWRAPRRFIPPKGDPLC